MCRLRNAIGSWRMTVEGPAANKRRDASACHFNRLQSVQVYRLLIYHNLDWLLSQHVCNTNPPPSICAVLLLHLADVCWKWGYSFSEHQGTNKLRKAYFAPAFLPLVAAELSGRQVTPVLPQVTHTELCGEPINSAWKWASGETFCNIW